MALGSLEPCTCTMECGCEQYQGEGLGDGVDDNGNVPNCPIADVKDDKDEVRTFFFVVILLIKSKPLLILMTTSGANDLLLLFQK